MYEDGKGSKNTLERVEGTEDFSSEKRKFRVQEIEDVSYKYVKPII